MDILKRIFISFEYLSILNDNLWILKFDVINLILKLFKRTVNPANEITDSWTNVIREFRFFADFQIQIL